MKNTLKTLCQSVLVLSLACLTLPAAALEQNPVLFVGDYASYTGSYSVDNKSIAVVIEGLPYRGYYSDKSSETGNQAVEGVGTNGSWGRAFLFASSAKVMQCALDAGFPMVSGRCRDADGRPYRLVPGSKL